LGNLEKTQPIFVSKAVRKFFLEKENFRNISLEHEDMGKEAFSKIQKRILPKLKQ